MINIQDIIPFMRDGWVAMDSNGKWGWYEEMPIMDEDILQWIPVYGICETLDILFDIVPANDWKRSLLKVGGK